MFPPNIPPFVSFITRRLRQNGHRAYLVGGAVRDACRNAPVTDWDVATSASSGDITSLFSGIRHFSLKHDTVTLVDAGCHYEITPFRNGARRIEEDLARRDFTVNAMACDPDTGGLIDPYVGLSDLKKKRIRAVGDPVARFTEDPLRLLRAVRLATLLRFRVEPETLRVLARLAPLVSDAATERIREELVRILTAEKPSPGFYLMARSGLLRHTIPELLEGWRRRQNAHHRYTIFRHIMETVDRTAPDRILRLTALFHDIAKPRVRKKIDGTWRFYGHEEAGARLASEIMERLAFDRRTIRKVTHLIAHHMIGYHAAWGDAAVRRLIRRVGAKEIKTLIAFRRADILAHGRGGREGLRLLQELEERVARQMNAPIVTRMRDLAVDGRKVMAVMGIPPGPRVGAILAELMEAVTESPDLNTPEHLVRLLERKKNRKSS